MGERTGKATILLVEDDPDVSESLAEVLIEEGYDVARVANGAEGLTYLRANPLPRLILLDLMMPVMDGYQFRKLQRAEPLFSSIPVVVISASVLDERVHELQLDGVLRKPLDLESLLRTVARFTA